VLIVATLGLVFVLPHTRDDLHAGYYMWLAAFAVATAAAGLVAYQCAAAAAEPGCRHLAHSPLNARTRPGDTRRRAGRGRNHGACGNHTRPGES
jgi:hypothetical protein